jgi:hypothetical protein
VIKRLKCEREQLMRMVLPLRVSGHQILCQCNGNTRRLCGWIGGLAWGFGGA